MNNQRYQRQQQVSHLGLKSQQSLADSHVVIVGAGGLGSPVSLYLAGAGVGKLTIIDHDDVSLSNLHRQILFNESDIGIKKVDAAKTHLAALNSEIEINTIAKRLTIDNAKQFIEESTVVVDAADNFLVTYILNDLCFEKRIPLISASVLTTHGYLGVFCGTKKKPAPSLRAVFPAPSAEVNNCNTAGVVGPSVGIIGSYQAQETLKVILDSESQLLGKLINFDLWDYQQHITDFSQSPEPVHKANIISLKKLPSATLLLDVRSPEELINDPTPTLSSDIRISNIPLIELSNRLDELDKSQIITCICKSGQRALNAAQQLLNHGFRNISLTSR